MTDITDRRYWVFDMDGTLTVAVHDFDAIRDELGLPKGRPILEQLEEMPESRAQPLRERLDKIEKDLANRATSQDGAKQLLRALERRGARTGILTRNSHANALATLESSGLSGYFDPRCVMGRESCRVKPSADGIRKLLDVWKAPAQKAVMVGDYLFDLIAGREAGTMTVYLDTTGIFKYKDHADLCVRNLVELAELL
jgi:phosphoglycolate phosphatase-like HAD superfamily hydrolase